ncbi:MAG TPA: putative Ig domain-containing protein [Steroidobacteraceae bacterium]|nr:putative Ig domain-containing protein [Steroidobacteraceae bacterium]
MRILRSCTLALALALAVTACGQVAVSQSASPAPASAPASGGAPATNSPPLISGTPATSIVAGQSYSFTPSASDADGDTLTFTVQNLPPWASFNASTGQLSGTAAQTGTFPNIVISVSDGLQSSALAAFTITVSGASVTNSPPVISGQPAPSVRAGSIYSFTPSASDPDGDALTFAVQNLPSWATFSSSTGTLSGTPGAAQAGSYANIVISVSDGTSAVSLPAFAIQVAAPLTISGSPPTQDVAGKSYSFQPTTNAPAGTALTFSIQNKPAWATFSAATGLLSGTPAASQTGIYVNIVMAVSDGTQSSALAPFSISVTAGPTISGTPPTAVNAGSPYSFTPTATDSSGQALAFSVQNQPAWASFNAANGALTGTPAAAQVGTYPNIVISVSDGSASASLPAFSIAVNAISSGSATLTWTAPTQSTDGSALTTLAGYKVYYGMSANALSTAVVLSNPSVTTYLVSNLSPGTWYFGVTAYTSAGTESSLSNVGTKTIN